MDMVFLDSHYNSVCVTGVAGRWSGWMMGIRRPGLSHQNPEFVSHLWLGLSSLVRVNLYLRSRLNFLAMYFTALILYYLLHSWMSC